MKMQAAMNDEELFRLREAKKTITKKMEDLQKDQEREMDKIREELRSAKKDAR